MRATAWTATFIVAAAILASSLQSGAQLPVYRPVLLQLLLEARDCPARPDPDTAEGRNWARRKKERDVRAGIELMVTLSVVGAGVGLAFRRAGD